MSTLRQQARRILQKHAQSPLSRVTHMCWEDALDAVEEALAAGSRRAKTAKPVECEASQSGAKRNAQGTPHD